MGWNVSDYNPIADLSAGYGFGRKLAMDRDLAAESSQPPGLENVGYANTNMADVGPQPMDQNTGLESARMSDVGPQRPNGAGLESARGSVPMPVAAQDAASRRAAIYRKYGDDKSADSLLSNSANLGLTNAQTKGTDLSNQDKELTLGTKKREDARNMEVRRLTEEAMAPLSSLTDEAGNPVKPSDDQITKARLGLATKLTLAGHVDAADAATKAVKDHVSDLIDMSKKDRIAKYKVAEEEILRGNLMAGVEYGNAFSFGLPNGATIHDIKPARQPGMVVMSFTDDEGQKQKVVPLKPLQDQMISTLGRMSHDDAYAKQQAYDHVDAQIKQAKAAARASDAAAGQHAASAESIRAGTKDAQSYQAAVGRQGTDAEKPGDAALIKGYDALHPNGRGGGATAESTKPFLGEVDGQKVTTNHDGTMMLVSNPDAAKGGPAMTWVPIGGTPARVIGPAPAGQPSPAGAGGESIPTDPNKRVVGKVYTNAAGKSAKWTGSGWQPM